MIVKPEFRTNPLSEVPAPVTVTVHYTNGRTLDYDNIHYPEKYVSKIIRDSRNGTSKRVINFVSYRLNSELRIVKC
jgi:hypothetical protein